MEAFGSPMREYAIKPPLIMSFGFIPKIAVSKLQYQLIYLFEVSLHNLKFHV